MAIDMQELSRATEMLDDTPKYSSCGTQPEGLDSVTATGPDTLLLDFAGEWVKRRGEDAFCFDGVGPDSIVLVEIADTRPVLLYRLHRNVAVAYSDYIRGALLDGATLRDGTPTIQIGGCPVTKRWASRDTMDFFARFIYRDRYMFQPSPPEDSDTTLSIIAANLPDWTTLAAAWCYAGFLEAPSLQNFVIDCIIEKMEDNNKSGTASTPISAMDFARMVRASWTPLSHETDYTLNGLQRLLLDISDDPWLCGKPTMRDIAGEIRPAIMAPKVAAVLPKDFKQFDQGWIELRAFHMRLRVACQRLLSEDDLEDEPELRQEDLTILELRDAWFPERSDYYVEDPRGMPRDCEKEAVAGVKGRFARLEQYFVGKHRV